MSLDGFIAGAEHAMDVGLFGRVGKNPVRLERIGVDTSTVVTALSFRVLR